MMTVVNLKSRLRIAVDEIDYVMPRLATEEDFKAALYDDATLKPVVAPVGKATIGFGCNVQAGWTYKFAYAVLKLGVLEVQDSLLLQPWYLALNAVRRSVMLDIGFNDGIHGLLEFRKMIAAIKVQDWVTAEQECHVTNAVLKNRYSLLSKLLLTGEIGP
jgi:hypothetical protein